MQRILIAYATTEGHTRKVAEYLAREARALGCSAEVLNVMGEPSLIDNTAFDKVIAAASVHMDKHQPEIEAFIGQCRQVFNHERAAFLSVSLSAAGDAQDRYTAWEYVRSFLSATDWQPAHVEIVAGALRFTEQDFFKRWSMKLLAKRKRMPRDSNTDYEYTDWEELSRFLKRFIYTPLTPSAGR